MGNTAHVTCCVNRYTDVVTNHRTPPEPIRTHLSRQHTTTVHSHAVIEQAFFPDLGWCDVTHLPFPTLSAIRVLRDRGATCIAVGYCKPTGHGGGTRVRADFTVRECLA
jgi:hypothetical protein